MMPDTPQARRDWERRHLQRLPFRNRRLIVKVRGPRLTWRAWWRDLLYLVRG